MSQMPPPPASSFPQPGFQPPAAPKTNGAALASLICGILGCVPVLTSIAAIILGLVGIKKSREPGTGGKGLAIAGIVLGFIGILGWAVGGFAMYRGYAFVKSKILEPTQLTSNSFITSLAKGDTATASNYTTGDLTQEKLQSLASQIQKYGEFKNISISGFNADQSGGGPMRAHITGSANFSSTSKGFRATLTGTLDSGFKIEDFNLD
jgi:hypothetical protein